MTSLDIIRLIIGSLFIIGLIFFVCYKLTNKKFKIDINFITKPAIFSALSIILYTVPVLKFPLPIFPAFLEIHFDEVPAFIAAFAYGPLSGFFVITIKTLIKLPLTTSMCVGEFADFLYGILLIVPASIIYKKKNNIKGALIGLFIGYVLSTVIASIFTSFVILNFYMSVMGLSEKAILGMCQAINPSVTSLGWTFCLLVALPFNALKNVIVIAITFIIYKRLHKLIDKISIKKLGS